MKPRSITTDWKNLYVTEKYDCIRQIEIQTQEVTTVAGHVDYSGSSDGELDKAHFHSPSDITTDGKALYVVDAGNNTIRKID